MLSLFLGTCIDAFRGSPGLYGPGLDWTFTMDAIVANPQIECELQQAEGCSEQQVEEWLRSMSRELQHVGVDFFERTSSIERLIHFAVSDFCRARATSYNEVYARLQRAMLQKLLGCPEEFEQEIEIATDDCQARWLRDLRKFVAFVRAYEVDGG